MLFNSNIFIFIFLPMAIVSYYFVGAKLKKPDLAKKILLFMSLWFYGYNNLYYLGIIIVSILVNYGVYCGISRTKWIKSYLFLGMIFNIGLLGYFKYYDFFIENMNFVLKTNWNLRNIILPLGISFYTFQQIGFIVDTYREKRDDAEAAKYKFWDYAVFVTFFPQLIAGPIVSHKEMICQFQSNKIFEMNYDNIGRGIYQFTLGLGKKVLIADLFGKAVNYGFTMIPQLDATNGLLLMLSYTLQIYFDFSGYSDMAMGLARMFQIELPVNFNSPYKATTIIEFWKRWHITLTRFLRNYVYIPLGGNRGGGI